MRPDPDHLPTKKAKGVSSRGNPSGNTNNYFWPLKSRYKTKADIDPIAREARTNRPVKKISSASMNKV
jgi:hypothetical protein